ncbi:uncharacterized protein LOC107995131 isoform X2 [Apis cerana]|uniref:uncharacterized protein LOC107995131 isoform X2 n=1 Tax=Apis cerana TaxID=7461 RepID=UPI002B224F7A|nr:uncharacterized protein LOC107995131 isoform X2 [Apis cerana]
MKLIAFFLYSILITIESSKCPESRKPHSTSCTIFYNCVNLPSGGYVWIPSKCTGNLIFQPYLRMCVLPGDSWTCDTLSTESSFVTNSIPDYFDQDTATPYPLIEDKETMEHKLNADDVSEINNIKESYLQTEDNNKKYYSMLNQLIHHLLIYKKITIPLELLASSSLPVPPSKFVTNLPLSSYLVQNYIQQNNNLQNTIITDVKLQDTTENSATLKNEINELISNTENSKNLSITDDENNIILIMDNIGNKQYLTIERYRSLGYHLDSQFVQVIPCIKNVRMPNMTNCIKYYICEPDMASVIEYSCPLFTAFNKYSKTCDATTYNKCRENENNKKNINVLGNVNDIFQTNKNIQCTEHGKIKDPTSEYHYYICYSASDNSEDIKSIRMSCPNGLIFCQNRKVCTTKRLCKIS